MVIHIYRLVIKLYLGPRIFLITFIFSFVQRKYFEHENLFAYFNYLYNSTGIKINDLYLT